MADEFSRIVNVSAGRTTIALSGGSTPRRFYEALAQDPFRKKIPWPRVEVFFGDERSVPYSHPDSNFGMAHAALLDRVDVTVHAMDAQAGDATGYEQIIRARVPMGPNLLPAFDIILLGVGTDGHTASLFPGTAALKEEAKLVVMNDAPKLGTSRMTFTFPLLNAARRVWILATGEAKRMILSECIHGGDPLVHPVTGIAPIRGDLVWWLDQAAAGQLPGHSKLESKEPQCP